MIRPSSSFRKDPGLEAVRGFAALSIFVWHCLIGFFRDSMNAGPEGIVNSPFFPFVHGTAMIGVLFLLSGYVLTARFFETGEARGLLISAIKRWFRFIPLVLLSVLVSYGLYRCGFYHYQEAARLSRSYWLFMNGGTAGPPVKGTFFDALKQGFFGAFFLSESSFNSNLWMMTVEMQGSYAALFFAPLLAPLRRQKAAFLLVALFMAGLLLAVNIRLEAFLIGVALAAYAPAFRGMKTPTAFALIAIGIYILGYRWPVGLYRLWTPFDAIPSEEQYVLTSAFGGALILAAVVGCGKINRFLDAPITRFLGFISFPFFLFQILVLGSLGAWLFTALAPDDPGGAAFLAGLASLMLLLIVSVPLAFFDAWWGRKLGAVARRVFPGLTEKRVENATVRNWLPEG